jgi:hypothetical protein
MVIFRSYVSLPEGSKLRIPDMVTLPRTMIFSKKKLI